MSHAEDRVIEVFADIWCPFAHVGLRAARAARERAGRADVGLVVRSWPLELVNGEPMSAAKTLEHVHELREFVAPDAFAHFDPDAFPTTTLPALALVARAYGASAELGERATFLVRDALFEDGRDIGDAAVIADLASLLGVGVPDAGDHDQVLADWRAGQERGVKGSPHFFCGELHVFCPALQISRKQHAHGLEVHADVERLRSFLDGCLGSAATPA